MSSDCGAPAACRLTASSTPSVVSRAPRPVEVRETVQEALVAEQVVARIERFVDAVRVEHEGVTRLQLQRFTA